MAFLFLAFDEFPNRRNEVFAAQSAHADDSAAINDIGHRDPINSIEISDRAVVGIVDLTVADLVCIYG